MKVTRSHGHCPQKDRPGESGRLLYGSLLCCGKAGEEIDFVEIAGIAYKGSFYAILQPVELLEGMDDDEALVFKVTRGKDGEDKFEVELDDTIIDAVFAEYNRLLAEAESQGAEE